MTKSNNLRIEGTKLKDVYLIASNSDDLLYLTEAVEHDIALFVADHFQMDFERAIGLVKSASEGGLISLGKFSPEITEAKALYYTAKLNKIDGARSVFHFTWDDPNPNNKHAMFYGWDAPNFY